MLKISFTCFPPPRLRYHRSRARDEFAFWATDIFVIIDFVASDSIRNQFECRAEDVIQPCATDSMITRSKSDQRLGYLMRHRTGSCPAQKSKLLARLVIIDSQSMKKAESAPGKVDWSTALESSAVVSTNSSPIKSLLLQQLTELSMLKMTEGCKFIDTCQTANTKKREQQYVTRVS